MSDVQMLMVAYVFPPLAGAGVYRTLKFAKYLPEHGVTPHVLGAEDERWYIRDETGALLAQLPDAVRVHRVPPLPTLRRLQTAYRLVVRHKGGAEQPLSVGAHPQEGGRPSLKRRLLDRLGVPDEQVYWVRPAADRGVEIARSLPSPRCLYSSAPPFSSHLAALRIQQRTGLPWIADFRDAWATNPVFMKGLDPAIVRQHVRLERRVVAAADRILCAAPGIAEAIRRAHPEHAAKVSVLTNGFDPADFVGIDVRPPADELVLSHVGELSITRDPDPLLRALAALRRVHGAVPVRLRFVGFRDAVLAERMDRRIEELGLTGAVTVEPAVSHRAALEIMRGSHVLVFQSAFKPGDPTVGRTYPGKLFEYMAAGRPVLGVVPGGESAELIDQTGCGWWRSPDDDEGLLALLETLYARWQRGERLLESTPDISPFDRRVLASQLADLAREVAR